MSNRAWMPLHLDDYLADTGHLSTLEHGAYLLLIMHYWRNGGLPADERMIARVARLTPEQWAESRDVLAALFREGWSHKRIDGELAKADAIIAKRKAAAGARHQGSKPDASAVHVHDECNANAHTRAGTPITNNLSDASASDEPPDPRRQVWSEGLATLMAITGKSETAAKSILGKWLKATEDDCALVLSRIRKAKLDRIGEPVSWITASLAKKADPPKARNAGVLALQQLRGMNLDDTSPQNRHLDAGDRNPSLASPGIARRVAVTPR